MFLSPKGSTEYVATSLLGYLPAALQAIPPVVFAIAIIGAIALLKRRIWLIPAMAAVFLAAHGAITALGVFASGGYPRFMVGIAPFVAILAAAGIQQACAHRQDSRRGAPFWIVLMSTWFLGWVALEIERRAGRLSIPHVGLVRAIRFLSSVVIMVCLTRIATPHISRMWRTVTIGLIVAVTLFQSVVLIQPMRLKPGQRRVRDAATWIHQNQLQGRPIYATNAWFPYFMNFVENPRVHKGKRLLAAMPAGTLVLWDSIYSDSDYHGVRLADLEADRASYRHVITFNADPNDRRSLRMRLFEKIADTPVPPDPDRPYPPSTSADPETIYTSYYIVP